MKAGLIPHWTILHEVAVIHDLLDEGGLVPHLSHLGHLRHLGHSGQGNAGLHSADDGKEDQQGQSCDKEPNLNLKRHVF